MRLLGNDLVDLKDRDSLDILKNSRFLNRVFSKTEQTLIREAASPFERAWLLWGAKEAAYKALKRANPELLFSPRKIIVKDNLKNVHIENLKLTLQWESASEWIHAWCHNLDVPPETAVTPLAGLKDSRPRAYSSESSLCRGFAVDYLEKKLGFTPEIQKKAESPRHPPLLYHNGEALPYILSLSHHGRYCALAFCPQ